ncbi:unnamed protein product [Amoebophrya sp. A120]|nr:unnamed protein product [Amoebophrya sp. A120]|eukprot:GSA120T00013149001.1
MLRSMVFPTSRGGAVFISLCAVLFAGQHYNSVQAVTLRASSASPSADPDLAYMPPEMMEQYRQYQYQENQKWQPVTHSDLDKTYLVHHHPDPALRALRRQFPGNKIVKKEVDEGTLISATPIEPTEESALVKKELEQLRDDIAKASRSLPKPEELRDTSKVDKELEELRQRLPKESAELEKLSAAAKQSQKIHARTEMMPYESVRADWKKAQEQQELVKKLETQEAELAKKLRQLQDYNSNVLRQRQEREAAEQDRKYNLKELESQQAKLTIQLKQLRQREAADEGELPEKDLALRQEEEWQLLDEEQDSAMRELFQQARGKSSSKARREGKKRSTK